MKNILLFLGAFLGTLVSAPTAWAASEHGHAAAHGPDMTLVMYQAINVGAIIIGLIYFLRTPVREFFAAQKAAYLEASQKTLAAKLAAEKELSTIRGELSRIEMTAQDSISRARAEAADLRKQMIQDAQAGATRIEKDAQTSVRLEYEKAIAALRADFIQDSVAAARQQMSGGVTQEDHQRLNKEFIRNIEAVQP